MRRLIREGDPPAGQLASPVPQYWNPNTEAFEDVLGAHGAPRAILYGPNGQPIGSSNPLPVADSALAQAVAQLATEGKLEEARALLETISQKDFATQTTLSEVLQRLEAIEEQLETGDAKVQLKGQIVEDVNGEQAVRTKQAALAYDAWFFDEQEIVVVAPGSMLREAVSHKVNGFSTLSFILRVQNPNISNHRVQVDVIWQSVPGNYSAGRRATEIIWDGQTGSDGAGTLSAFGITSTKSEYVLLEVRNHDTVDHGYHIAALLRV